MVKRWGLATLILLFFVPTVVVGQTTEVTVDSIRFEHLEDSTWTSRNPLEDLSSQYMGVLVKEEDDVRFTVSVGKHNGGYLIILGTVRDETDGEETVSIHHIEDVIFLPEMVGHHRIGAAECSVKEEWDSSILALFEDSSVPEEESDGAEKDGSTSCSGPRGVLEDAIHVWKIDFKRREIETNDPEGEVQCPTMFSI